MGAFQSLDVTRILGIGSIGFGFLLAFLSYRLLAQAQRSPRQNPQVLRLIQVFMLFSLALCCGGFWLEYEKLAIGRDAERAAAPNPKVVPSPTDGLSQFWISFRVEDSEGKPLEGVTVSVVELAQDGTKIVLSSEKSSESGGVNFPVTLKEGRKIKIETSSAGYLGQELVLQKNAITLPARLTRSGHKVALPLKVAKTEE
jgi:hypothetical protein